MGAYRVQFKHPDTSKRATPYLGAIDESRAGAIHGHVEEMLEAADSGVAFHAETLRWLKIQDRAQPQRRGTMV